MMRKLTTVESSGEGVETGVGGGGGEMCLRVFLPRRYVRYQISVFNVTRLLAF